MVWSINRTDIKESSPLQLPEGSFGFWGTCESASEGPLSGTSLQNKPHLSKDTDSKNQQFTRTVHSKTFPQLLVVDQIGTTRSQQGQGWKCARTDAVPTFENLEDVVQYCNVLQRDVKNIRHTGILCNQGIWCSWMSLSQPFNRWGLSKTVCKNVVTLAGRCFRCAFAFLNRFKKTLETSVLVSTYKCSNSCEKVYKCVHAFRALGR